MSKNLLSLLALFFVSGCLSSRCDEKKKHSCATGLMSYYQGYIFCENRLKTSDMPYDLNQVIEGMRAAERGEKLPFDQNSLNEVVTQLQEELLAEQEKNNLIEAEIYLAKIAKESDIVELIPSKLYFKQLRAGSGKNVSEESPFTVSYTAKILKNGEEKEVLSLKNTPISLSNTIPGFSIGTQGMRLGEQRKLYIHPDLAYGTYGGKVDPNQLIIFEVEIESLPY